MRLDGTGMVSGQELEWFLVVLDQKRGLVLLGTNLKIGFGHMASLVGNLSSR